MDILVGESARPQIDHPSDYIPAHARIIMLAVVILPFLGLIAGILFVWGRGFSWIQLGVFLGSTGRSKIRAFSALTSASA